MANSVDDLLSAYEKVLNMNWEATLSGQERIWFLVYEPELQRKVDFRLVDFENATKKAGKKWALISLKEVFPDWMANHEYREEYFANPNHIKYQYESSFKPYLYKCVSDIIKELSIDENTVLTLHNTSSLFGFTRLSELLNHISRNIPGRLLVLFPGEFEKNQFRLLDARDGWSYLARPITA